MITIALNHPAVDGAGAFPGLSPAGFSNVPNFGMIFIRLKPFAERTAPEMKAGAVVGAIMPEYSKIKDGFAFILQPPPILGLGNSKGFKLYLQDRANIGLPALFE